MPKSSKTKTRPNMNIPEAEIAARLEEARQMYKSGRGNIVEAIAHYRLWNKWVQRPGLAESLKLVKS